MIINKEAKERLKKRPFFCAKLEKCSQLPADMIYLQVMQTMEVRYEKAITVLSVFLALVFFAGCSFSFSTANVKDAVMATDVDKDGKPADTVTEYAQRRGPICGFRQVKQRAGQYQGEVCLELPDRTPEAHGGNRGFGG